MNRKLNEVIDGAISSDIMKYFDEMDSILEANGGVGDAKTLTIDACDPPCPRDHGQFTKVKITDDSIHITNIDKSSIGFQVELQITPEGNFWQDILREEPRIDTDTSELGVDDIERENQRREVLAYGKQYRNRIIKWFVGFKSSIHAIESYRVFSGLKKTNCEQAEAIYETACARMLKPQEELDHKPQIYTLWSHANDGDDCVCGTYFTLQDLIDAKYAGKNYLTVTFDCTIPLDDFLPFSAMTMFPNKIFENMMLELKLGLTSNIVICQVDPRKEFERLMKTTVGGSPGAEKALYLHLQMDVPNYSRRFTQMGDPFVSTIYSINDDQTISDNSVGTRFTCSYGKFNWLRSFINGFNIKDSLLELLRQKYTDKPLVIPAQICDFMAFGQAPQTTGMKCNCTYGLTNCCSLMFLFPRTPNELTCSENPHMHSIQIQVDSKPYPDKSVSTLEPAHTMFNLTNAGLDGLFSPNEEYAYSLIYNEMVTQKPIYTREVYQQGQNVAERDQIIQQEMTVNYPYKDNTSYCFVVATERLGGYGNFCDGLTRDNCQITLSSTTMGPARDNPYVYNAVLKHPVFGNDNVMNTTPAKMIICQDCFWEFRVDEPARWISNDKNFYYDATHRSEMSAKYHEMIRQFDANSARNTHVDTYKYDPDYDDYYSSKQGKNTFYHGDRSIGQRWHDQRYTNGRPSKK